MENQSLIHADIFFFISTIALFVISVGISIALFYLIKILRNVRDISDKAKIEGVEIIADLKTLRRALRDEGVKWRHVADLIRTFFTKKSETVSKKASVIKSTAKRAKEVSNFFTKER